jgi:hypothetical protein
MNYIEQINVFWLLDEEHSFNGNESRLYFYLLKKSNSLYWKNPLTNADGHTATMVGISVNTLKTARNRLQQAGLIQFKAGGSGARDKTVYQIISAENVINKVSTIDTLSAKSLTPYPPPYQQKADDISKQKQNVNKTKPLLPAVPAPRVVKKKKNEEKETEPHWAALVKTWFHFNLEKFGDEPIFQGSETRSLKNIVILLKKRAEKKEMEWTEAAAVDRFRSYLLACFADEWLAAHFLLGNLETQFDKIILNHGNNRKITGGVRTPGRDIEFDRP